MLQDKYAVAKEKIVKREIDGEIYLFDSKQCLVHRMDKAGKFFFNTLINNTSFASALHIISSKYSPDVHQQVETDFWSFCKKLQEAKVLLVGGY